MNNLTKKQENLILAVYSLGYFDRDAKLLEYNNAQTKEEKLEWLKLNLFPTQEETMDLELIDSVS